MAAMAWRVLVCVATLMVLCEFGLAKKENDRGRYIDGHPLLDGGGARGRHLYGYGGHREYRPSPKFNHQFKNYHSDSYGYGPYDSHPKHRGYDVYPRHPSRYDHLYQPESHHQEEYPREDHYSGPDNYKVYSHQDYPNPHHRYGYFPYPYNQPYYPSSEVHSPRSEAQDMMKVVDKEIHLTKPQDKVLYERNLIEEEDTEEPDVEEAPVVKAEEITEEPEKEPEVEELLEDVDEEEEVEAREEPEAVYAEESSEEATADEEEDEPEAEEDKTEEETTYQPSDDYSGYTYGYAGAAPINLESTFCIGQADGNFANPGLTEKADPRCTYVTCAGNRTILFNCAPGTFNGRFLEYHLALWSYPSPDYQNAPHVRFESFGQDFCGQLDVGSVTDSPVCTTSKRVIAEIPEQPAQEDTYDDVAQEDTYDDVAQEDTYDDVAQEEEPEEKSEEVAAVYSTDMEPASSEGEAQQQPEPYTEPEGRAIEETQTSVNQDTGVPDGVEVDATEVKPVVPKEDAPEVVVTAVEVPVETPEPDSMPAAEVDAPVVDVPEVAVTPVHPPEVYVTPVYDPEVDVPEIDVPTVVDVPQVDIPQSKPEGKSLVQGSLTSEDYTGYKSGYGGPPEVLDNDFCVNMEDGNYANPGLTPNVDPRCTYITCSGAQTFVFSCPLGTFNGATYKHHYPLYGPEVSSYATAHHYKYGTTGFCGEGDYKGVCSR